MIYDLAIIGGGASGMSAAITAARRGLSVIILEKNDRIGKKLLATGNGKCNLAGTLPLLAQYNTTKVKESFDIVNRQAIQDFFHSIGLRLRERDTRVYPYSEQSGSVLNALRTELSKLKVEIYCNKEILSIDGCCPFTLIGGNPIVAKNILLASGTNAGFGTNSMDIYKKFGHSVSSLRPSLVPLLTDNSYIKGLKGVRVQAGASLYLDDKLVRQTVEEVLFKDNGLSGTAIFYLSTALARARKYKKAEVILDFIPELTLDELYAELIQRLASGFTLEGVFHKEIINNLYKRMGADLSAENAMNYASMIKNYVIDIKDLSSETLSQVMSGGLAVDEFDLNTMQSKLQKGLYASGEVLDVDGECGGYNLMWAFCSGILAGQSV